MCLDERYLEAVVRAGGNPYVALSGDPGEMAARMEGILFSGGGDIHPACYGESESGDSRNIDSKRDICEFGLFRAFLARKKPMLGICRGMQLINVAFGGNLWQDMQKREGENLAHEQGSPLHTVKIKAGSRLASVMGLEQKVNTSHHQALRTLGRGLEITAESRDGVIEGVEHTILPIWGVQWHPERMAGGERIFDSFMECVRVRARNGR